MTVDRSPSPSPSPRPWPALLALLALLAVLLALPAGASAAVDFIAAPNSPFYGGGEVDALAVRDLNGDGALDVVTAGLGGLGVLLGDGHGGFADVQAYAGRTTGHAEDSVALADVNGDGHLDVATVDGVIGYSSDQASIRLGNGDGTLGTAQAVSSGLSYPEDVATGDFNGDGEADLAFVGSPTTPIEEQVSVALGNGDGTFQAAQAYTIETGHAGGGALAVGDVNGDGAPDIVAAAGSSQTLGVLVNRHDGSGTFTLGAGATLPADGENTYDLAAPDLNGDGKADAAIVHGGNAGHVYALLSDGHGGMSQTWAADVPATQKDVRGIASADFDGDGKPDLVAGTTDSGYDAGMTVFAGQGDGTFAAGQRFSPQNASRDYSLGLGDFDGDGATDVVFGAGSQDVSLMLADTAQPPVTTTGAADDVALSSATLHGTVDPLGQDTTYHFAYGTTTAYGSATADVDAGSGRGAVDVTEDLTGLQPGTTYHYCLVATNAAGTSGCTDGTFITHGPPSAVTDAPSRVGSTSAERLDGTVNAHGETTSWHFEYGLSAAYGSRTPDATAVGTTDQAVSYGLGGLQPGATYHVRLVATNIAGTTYGADRTFVAPPADTPTTTTPPPSASGTPPRVEVTLTPGQQTIAQRTFDVAVRCSEACDAALQTLTLRFTKTGDPATLDRFENGGGSLDALYPRSATYDLAGAPQVLAAGQTATLHGTLPLNARGPVAEVLGHGGAVRMDVSVAGTADGRRGLGSDDKVLVVEKASAAAHAAGVFSTHVETLPHEEPTGKRWRYEATITGRQVTTWSYDVDRPDSTDPGCILVNHGRGTQTIDFQSSPAVTVAADDQGGVVTLFDDQDGTPFDLPTRFDVDRKGSIDVGVAGPCHGVASGGGSGQPKDDCGTRTLNGSTQLSAEPLLTGSQRAFYVTPAASFVEPYKDCPFEGADTAQYDFDLLPTIYDHDLAGDLTGPQAPKPGESVQFTARRSFTRPLEGGQSTTTITWNVALKLLELPCPKGFKAGRIHVSVCVDQQAKADAEAAITRLTTQLKIDADNVDRMCVPDMAPDSAGGVIPCLIAHDKEAWDQRQLYYAYEIANDPPDKHFRQVARPHPAKLPALRGGTPAMRRLRSSYASVLGLSAALATTIDRASGARAEGSPQALDQQNVAALGYARRLATLLSRQPALERRVRAQLLHGYGAAGRRLARCFATAQSSGATQRLVHGLRHFAQQRIRRPRRHHG